MSTAARTMVVDGRWARVRVAGDPTRPTLLLLHGITRSLEDWDPVFDRLADRYHLIAVDLPGYGWSAPHPDGAGLAALADGVAQTLAALGVDRPAHVVGNSLGGAVTMTLLARHPERVASMTLVDSAGFGRSVTPLLRVLGIPVLGKVLATRINLPSAWLQERLIFADGAHVTRRRLRHAMAIGRETEAGLTAWRTVDQLGTVRGGIKSQWRTELNEQVRALPRPTLVTWGGRDRVLPTSHVDNVRRYLPQARIHLFPDVGHMPQLECPGEFSGVLDEFVGSLTAPAAVS